jgi:hypothetical protein
MLDGPGGLVGRSGCCPGLGGPIDPSLEFRFWFLWGGMIIDCPVRRCVRTSTLLMGDDKGDEGDGDNGWLSFFLKNLPKIFFGPLVGVKLSSVRAIIGAVGDVASVPPDASDRADEAGVCVPSEVPDRSV